MPADLLFEIGCEEIPAKMLSRALADLPNAVKAKLDAARLEHKSIKVLGTPRRLAVIVKGLAERQPDLREEVVGPPVSAARLSSGSSFVPRSRPKRSTSCARPCAPATSLPVSLLSLGPSASVP